MDDLFNSENIRVACELFGIFLLVAGGAKYNGYRKALKCIVKAIDDYSKLENDTPSHTIKGRIREESRRQRVEKKIDKIIQ